MKRLLWIIPALLLGGCVAVPYDPYPYYGYAQPAPVYVVPSASVYYGYGGGYRGGWGGRGRWRH
ncbi:MULTISPECIES: hypothetical protein [unclassified Herbaspirillum]|uniref:hypothetical protein n=1 Tax=unclassified Herbaspirillum TaxID=2624150 RepID=UPI000E2ECFE9|nr:MULTISPECIES: hypothetical protein [unclassified Herbaspirillum]RFB73774.1 hypothetical protein DZB54_05730 [Herbaspirillum sp. 3R-3a1]TFI10416.1 hypothetical protein E4P32_02440 [Herbaspirillum sp. 3R11]TFI16321.1 hypothetical protein E4P31_02445 [Herbaspirillum sp. 3R-11]TFI25718.1 hypothetical protein E4P30_13210 [Herbaspirillum sp. 3C11]